MWTHNALPIVRVMACLDLVALAAGTASRALSWGHVEKGYVMDEHQS